MTANTQNVSISIPDVPSATSALTSVVSGPPNASSTMLPVVPKPIIPTMNTTTWHKTLTPSSPTISTKPSSTLLMVTSMSTFATSFTSGAASIHSSSTVPTPKGQPFIHGGVHHHTDAKLGVCLFFLLSGILAFIVVVGLFTPWYELVVWWSDSVRRRPQKGKGRAVTETTGLVYQGARLVIVSADSI